MNASFIYYCYNRRLLFVQKFSRYLLGYNNNNIYTNSIEMHVFYIYADDWFGVRRHGICTR